MDQLLVVDVWAYRHYAIISRTPCPYYIAIKDLLAISVLFNFLYVCVQEKKRSRTL